LCGIGDRAISRASSPRGNAFRSHSARSAAPGTCAGRNCRDDPRQGYPEHAVCIGVAAARPEAGRRHLVELGERSVGWIVAGHDPHGTAGIAQHAAPDCAVSGTDRHAVVVTAMRLSLVGSSGCWGSTHSSRLPLPLVSRTNGVQPCDLTSSPVSSYISRFNQPSTPGPTTPALVHNVLLASEAKLRWWVGKHRNAADVS